MFQQLTGSLFGLRIFLLISVLGSITMLGCTKVDPAEKGGVPENTDISRVKNKLVFMAGFRPQANLPFVAAYVAHKKGFFDQQGLDVEIRHASGGEHLKLLMAGDVDVTTAAASSVLKRRADPSLPIVAVALFGQRGQQGYMALKNSKMSSPKDWEGKVFGYKISVPPDYLAMLEIEGVDRSTIREVRVGFDPRVLTDGDVDVLAVFKSNEPNIVRNKGFEVDVWYPEDFGVPTMGLTYIIHSDFSNQNPTIMKRFLKATLKGLKYALDNRDEAVDIVLDFAPRQEREHQRFMLDQEFEDAVNNLTNVNGLGWMSDEQWLDLYNHLIEFEALPVEFDYKTAFTNQFLKDIYDENGSLIWP